ncbi:MAG: hypothetical protein IT350_09535 [Deltaproteobacteria bacterium]|nr:hypothetical protein [Deltaproteobacteria bacterium]
MEITAPVADKIDASGFIWRIARMYERARDDRPIEKGEKNRYIHYEGDFEEYAPWSKKAIKGKILPKWFHGLIDDTFVEIEYDLPTTPTARVRLTFGSADGENFHVEHMLSSGTSNSHRFQIAERIPFEKAMGRALDNRDQSAFSSLLAFWCYQSFNNPGDPNSTIEDFPSGLMLDLDPAVTEANIRDAATWDHVTISVVGTGEISISRIWYVLNTKTILDTRSSPPGYERPLPEYRERPRPLALSVFFNSTIIDAGTPLHLSNWIKTFRVNQCGYTPSAITYDTAFSKDPLYVAALRIGHTWRPEYPKKWRIYFAPNGVEWWWAAPPWWCGEFAYWVLTNSNWEFAGELEWYVEQQGLDIDSPDIVAFMKTKDVWISASTEDRFLPFDELQRHIRSGYYYAHDNGYAHSGFFIEWQSISATEMSFFAINGNNGDVCCRRECEVVDKRQIGGRPEIMWREAPEGAEENGGFGIVGEFIVYYNRLMTRR